jgi:ornithine decarboxylase
MTPKIQRFLAENDLPTPFLVVDLEIIERNYRRLRHALPLAEIYYAVKANPAPQILDRLVGLGSKFDAASLFEIEECFAAGARPEAISYGSTIKKAQDIAGAYSQGVRLYAFDSDEELEKLARHAPGSQVYCRLLLTCDNAEWPLGRKFGCDADMARELMLRARTLGLDPCGISFHVGSQQIDPQQWDGAIGRTAMLFTALNEAGIDLRMINLGGGFPVRYRKDIPSLDTIAEAIMAAMRRCFGNRLPEMLIEPGRAICGDAGLIQTEVVLVAKRSRSDDHRWVYLDTGTFHGLAETMGEAIQYDVRLTGHREGEQTGRVVLAGPTCDSVDIMYEKADYRMPLSLRAGDKAQILSTGAYTTTYSSVGFNGLPPLRAYYI